MVDSAYITGNCTPANDIDCHGKTPHNAAATTRSSLSASLRTSPPDNVSAPLQQAALPNLQFQGLQLSAKQSNYSQMAAMAACIGNTFNGDSCAIVRFEPAEAPAQITCWFADAPLLPMQPLKMSEPFEDWLADTSPIHCSDTETLDSPSGTPAGASKILEIWQFMQSLRSSLPQVKAFVYTKTYRQGQANGAILLMRSRPHLWTQSEIAGLHAVSHQVASAFDQLHNQQISKQMQYQRVVNQLTLAIHNASDLNAVLNLATDGTAAALQVQRGMLLRLKHWDSLFRNHAQTQLPKTRVTVAYEWLDDPNEETYQPQAIAAASAPTVPTAVNQSFWLSECGLCQWAFLHPGTPLTISGNQQSPLDEQFNLGQGAAAAFNMESLPALLLTPLESKGTILGFLVFQHNQPHVWQPEELELVQLVSAQVSTAIIQTETLRQVQSLVEKRTAELRESLSVQAKLYDRTRYQLDQLRHLNQVRDEFLSTVSHELRTPLTSMTMAIRMLRQVGLSAERSTCYLDILEQQCAQETSLINDLLGLQELESNQVAISLQEIDLKALIQDLARLFHQKWATKGLTLEVKFPRRSLRLLSDRDSLHRILFELLTNAGKYAHPNSCVHLKVALKAESATHQIIVTLRNVGQGIAPDELPLIFDKFKRCQIATQNAVQGTGLGLALVKSLILHLNGDISASSEPTDDANTFETCFTLTLPQTFDNSKGY